MAVFLLLLLALLAVTFVVFLVVDGARSICRRWLSGRRHRPVPLRVRSRRNIGDEYFIMTLEHPAGLRPLPPFVPGQHLILHAPAGPNGATIKRAYSLAAWEQRPTTYELAIKREPQGTMSQWLWGALHDGGTVLASKPQGHFVLQEGGGAVVLIGGGVGITPLRAMVHQALGAGRPVLLFYTARRVESLLYHDEFTELAGQQRSFRYFPRLTQARDEWSGARGRLSIREVLSELNRWAVDGPPCRIDFYLCAGERMMAALHHGLRNAGVGEACIHREAFGVSADASRSGLSVTVKGVPDHQSVRYETRGEPTLLACLESNGLAVASECRAGTCGLCEVVLESGDVDWLLRPERSIESGRVLTCVCAARNDVVIRLPE